MSSRFTTQIMLLSTLAFATSTPVRAGDSVKFRPFGTVPERCSISASGSTTRTVDLRAAGSDAMDFDIDCNLPIEIEISADKGVFGLDTAPEHTADYTDAVPYAAGFSLPIDGSAWTVSGEAGTGLTGPGKTFAPGGSQGVTPPFDATLTFRMNWDAPTAKLLAGTYRETITITVTGQDTPALVVGF